MRIEKLRQNFDVKIKWVHFPLHPDTPMEGRTMEELFAGRNVDLKANYEAMVVGPLGKPMIRYNLRS